jgi:hypothetical protein
MPRQSPLQWEKPYVLLIFLGVDFGQLVEYRQGFPGFDSIGQIPAVN